MPFLNINPYKAYLVVHFYSYSQRNVFTEIAVHTIVITANKTMIPITDSTCVPIEAAFISLIPCVNGNTDATFCNPEGNNSNGIVAPDKNSIGKYTRLVTAFVAFTVLHRLAISKPILNMETNVKSHAPIKKTAFPFILY